jgi:hypothetical protein
VSRRKEMKVPALAGVVSAGIAGAAFATEVPGDVPVNSDLTAVIALQGLPCGKVVEARQQGSDDYLATCDDGHRYRVFVNADGRVVVVEERD